MSEEAKIYREVETILSLLRDAHQTLATAESLTGGLLSGALTAVPGASEFFIGGVIAYDPGIKSSQLGVDPELIKRAGVVSREVAIEMAAGAMHTFKSTWAIATTGVAGPGASAGVPAGKVWIAIAGPTRDSQPFAEELTLTGDRQSIRATTIARALAAFTRILRG